MTEGAFVLYGVLLPLAFALVLGWDAVEEYRQSRRVRRVIREIRQRRGVEQ